MNNAKTVEEIYSLIKNDLNNSDYNDIEKLAYMIMIIARERSFSSEYHWNNKENKSKITKDLFHQEKVADLNDPQLICVTAARILKYIAKKFDINIYFLGTVSGRLTEDFFDGFLDYEHIMPVYRISNNHYISVDVERNLDNVQTGKKWYSFGRKNNKDILIELPEVYINEIMKKIGYINNPNDYLDFYIESLFEKNYNDTILKKLEILIQNTNLSKTSSKLKSSVDIFRFYKKIIKAFICDDNRVLSFGGRICNIDDKKKFITGIYYNEYDFEKFWLWSGFQNKMVEVSREYLESFINMANIKIYSGKDYIDAEEILKLDSIKKKAKVNNYNQFIIK